MEWEAQGIDSGIPWACCLCVSGRACESNKTTWRRGDFLYTIQIGSFVLNGQILLFIVFGLAGWAAMRGYLKKISAGDDYGTIAFNASVIWLLVWKASPLLLDPVLTIKHPTSLLYFDGGVPGQWIASMIAGLYVAYRVWKGNMSWKVTAEVATVFLLGGAAAYHAGLIWFKSNYWSFYAGNTVLALVTVLLFFISKKPISLTSIMQRWQWFSIGLTVLGFLNPERTLLILSFSSEQAVSFALAMVLSVFLWLYHGQQTNGRRGNH